MSSSDFGGVSFLIPDENALQCLLNRKRNALSQNPSAIEMFWNKLSSPWLYPDVLQILGNESTLLLSFLFFSFFSTPYSYPICLEGIFP